MNLRFGLQPNSKLTLRDPGATELGRKIVSQGLLLMYQVGYEHFTFKKLADVIDTKEASIYRYFENKHRLLLYFLTWYWNLLEYGVVLALANIDDPALKIRRVVQILANTLPDWAGEGDLDKAALHGVARAESSKVYLLKEVDAINGEQLFKPYKDLCRRIADLFSEYAPNYPYPRSLASTVIEMSQLQPYFAQHLPALTDHGRASTPEIFADYLQQLVFAALDLSRVEVKNR